ncbi:MAG TPA: hypothetical protein VGP63_06275 [Planctomycetaceae bacterium]|nr:hypothetical protein [Planctomycetaceae bacterium]
MPLQQQPLHRVILGVVVTGFVVGVCVTAALVDILAPQYENETWIRAAGGVGAAIVLAAFVIWLKVKADRDQNMTDKPEDERPNAPKPDLDHYANVNAIRRILLSEWNPIGVDVPDDEYDSYIPNIYALVQQRASLDTVSSHLGSIVERMGLQPVSEHNRRAAALLLSIMA